jgi:predicted transcriptional regulator
VPSPVTLGTLERAVMEVVWSRAPVTSREVCDRMTGAGERAYTTVTTTMDRLFRRGLLTRDKHGLAWRYAAKLSKSDYERALAGRLASDILASHGENALAAFVDAAAEVDEALLDRLRLLIEERLPVRK